LEHREPEQVDRIADVLYAISRFIVVVCILPIAIWFATFALLEPIISDFFVRVLVSSAFGVGLFGILLLLTGRHHAGAVMLDLSILASAISLSILWNTLHASIACFHGYFLATLPILVYLKRKEKISLSMWDRTRFLFGALAITTGPIAISATLLFYSTPQSFVATIFPASLAIYLIVTHSRIRNPRFGIVHSVLLGLSSGLLSSHLFIERVGFLEPIINMSVFLFGCGIGILTSSQVGRELERIRTRRTRQDTGLSDEEIEKIDDFTRYDDEWIIEHETAHTLSGFGVILISIGSSPIFLWLAQLTDLGLLPQFNELFIPFTLLLSLLVLAPSPVFFRLGRRINRDKEGIIIRGIGFFVVLLASLTAFSWTQVNLWEFYISLALSSFLFIMGITGLFRRIRRLWRILWLRIIGVFRAIKNWIQMHPLQTGIAIDTAVSSFITLLLSQTLYLLPDPLLTLLLTFVTTFSLLGTIGLLGLKRMARRNQFLAASWTIFLCAVSSYIFWNLYRLQSMDLLLATTVSLLPLLLTSLLLKVQIQRTRVAIPYVPAVVSFSYLARMFELQIPEITFPLFTVLAVVLLLAPILHVEYRRFLMAIYDVILISSAVLLCFALFLVEFYLFIPIMNLDLVTSVILLSVIFFAAYLPIPRKYEKDGSTLLTASIMGLAVSVSLLLFISSIAYHIVIRILVALFVFSLILLLSKDNWPEKYEPLLITVTWSLFLALVSFLLYSELITIYGDLISIAASGLLFGFGLLPLQRLEVIDQYVRILYLFLALLSGTSLVYLLTFNPTYSLFALILLPIPVAYQYYNRFIRYLGSATRTGIRLFLFYAAIHLVLCFAIIGITLSYIINRFLTPFFSTYPIPAIPLTLMFILIALLIWSPALYIRRNDRPRSIPVIVAVLSVIISLNIVTLLQHPDLILSISLTVLISTSILTLSRSVFPENINQYFIPVTWCSVVAAAARFGYLGLVPLFGDSVSALFCIAISGLSLLPLKLTKVPTRYVNLLYGVFTFPAAILLAVILNLGLLIIIITIIIVPIPVAYKQYLSGIRALAKAIEYGIHLAVVQIIIHLVAAVGVAAATLSGLLVILLYPFFELYPISAIPVILTFMTFLLLLWLPAFTRDSEENQKFIESGLAFWCAIVSGNIIYLAQLPDVILSILGIPAIFGFLLALVSPRITLLESTKIPASIAVASLVLIGIYLIQVDIFTKALLLVLSSSLFSLLYLNEDQIAKFTYPLSTGSFFGIVFWQYYLVSYEAILILSGYICIETCFLSFLEKLRKYSWCIFASTLGIVVYILLEPMGVSAILVALLIGLETLWRIPETPELETTLEEYVIYHNNVKAVLIALLVAFLILPLTVNLVLVGETFLLILLMGLSIANRRSASVLSRYVVSLATTLTLSAIAFTFAPLVIPSDSLLLTYPSLIIASIFFVWRSQREPFRQVNWHVFSIIIAMLLGIGWYIIYASIESLILVISTFVSSFLVLEIKIPERDWKRKSELIPAISSIILLAEIIWVWHALLFSNFGVAVIFIGSGLILLYSIVFPISGAIDWASFKHPWRIVTIYASLGLTILFTGWDLFSLQLPINPLQPLGTVCILYSLLATPLVRKAEKSRNVEDEQLKIHNEWIPAILGSTALFLQFGLTLTTDLRMIFGLALLGFSLAGIVYLFLMPVRIRSIAMLVNLSLATSLAMIFWLTFEEVQPLHLLIYTSASIWIIVSLPVTLGMIKSFFSLCKRIILENKLKAAVASPIILGILVGFYLSPSIFTMAILDLILIWIASLILIPASLYFLGSLLLEESVAQRLRKPTIALLGPGVLLTLLIQVTTGVLFEGYPLIVQLSLIFASSLWLLCVISKILSLDYQMRIFYGVSGLAIAPTIYSYLPLLVGENLIFILLWTVFLVFIIEAPLFTQQLRLFLHMLKDLGLLFRTIVRKFNIFMNYIFEKYGFFAWTAFSVVFVVIFGFVSYPFFSELLNMPIVGFLYIVPSFSFPTMLLGLLLLFIGIVRRKVKTSFGSVSGFLTILGFGVTAFCGLYDNGYPYLAVAMTVLSICLLALIVRREVDVGDEYFLAAWIPIPLSVSAILLYYLYLPAVTIEAQVLAVLLSLFPALCLFIASAYASWIPKNLITPLWIILSLLSGLIAYLSSYLAVFPPLATIYLSVFIASIVMYPVTGRKMIHLFFAPLFFSLTGFAFTFMVGEFYQSLLLALASALFFVSRFVKEKRDESPDKIYIAWLRVAILIVLLLAVGVFVVTLFFPTNI